MANRIEQKWHLPQSLSFDGSPHERLIRIITVQASQTRNGAANYFVNSIACKIPYIGVFVSSGANGMTSFNLCIGPGNPLVTGLVVPDDSDQRFPPTVNTTTGLCLYQGATGPVDQVLSLTQDYSGAVFPTSEPDAIFPGGTPFTLRYTSGVAVSGGAYFGVICIPVNIRASSSRVWTWANSNVG